MSARTTTDGQWVRALQDETVDALCWRHYEKTATVVEMVMEANTGLASFGSRLPHGTAVFCPSLPTKSPPTTLTLWS